MYKYKVILRGCTRNSGNYIYNHLLSLVQSIDQTTPV